MIGPHRTALRRRTFLASAATALGASFLPRRAAAQAGEMALWTPGGSPLFCEIHTSLLAGWAEGQGRAATTVCGRGQNTEYMQTLVGAITAGNPPDVSILWDSPVTLASQGAYVALDEMMRASAVPHETWPAGLLRSCQFGGQTFGLPVTAGVYGMWYNAEMFEAKGIPSDRASFPKTWDEMRRLSKEFTVWDGDRLEVAGFMPPRDAASLPIWSALNGGRIFDGEAVRYVMDSPTNVEMFDYFVAWLDEEYKGDVNLIDRSGAFDAYPSQTTGLGPAFRENRMAGLSAGSWLMGDIWVDPVPTFERWDIAPYPVGPSGTEPVSGTWPNWFVIPAGAPDPQAAFDYLAWLSVEGVSDWYRQIPDLPVNAQVEPPPPQVVVDRRGQAFAEEITAFLQSQAAIATPMWDSPVQSFGQDQLARAIEKIYTKVASPAEALAEAQAASQAELDRVLGG